MGFGEMRLIAARTAGASEVCPVSTTTTPSSPTCTPMFDPVPTITKKEGRTSKTSRLFDGTEAACEDDAFNGWRLPLYIRESAATTATTAVTRARREQANNVILIIFVSYRGG